MFRHLWNRLPASRLARFTQQSTPSTRPSITTQSLPVQRGEGLSSFLHLHQRHFPSLLRVYSRLGGLILHRAVTALAKRVKVEFVNHQATLQNPGLFCLWHQDVFSYYIMQYHHRQQQQLRQRDCVQLTHPSAYMGPIFDLNDRMGISCANGSSGSGGREGADLVVRCLKLGADGMLCPDGPAGPVRTLKKGALHIALQSMRPIIPLRFEHLDGTKMLQLPSWDQKRVPLPGATLRVMFGHPVYVRSLEEFDVALRRVSDVLNGINNNGLDPLA